MKHLKPVTAGIPLHADDCCDCQERKVAKGKTGDVWAKCESLGVCSGPSYVCVPTE